MVEVVTIRLLRRLQEEGYTYLVSKRTAGEKPGLYFAEKGEDWPAKLSGYPLEEDDALSIDEALRWLTDDELKELLCVTTYQSTDISNN